MPDDKRYWAAFRAAAASADFPRSSERRHFRGKAAIEATEYLYEVGVEGFWEPILKHQKTYKRVPLNWLMQYLQTYPQFGPWIAFKVADMIERLGIANVEFYTGAMFLFDSPSEGAELLWDIENPGQLGMSMPPGGVGEWAVDRILTVLAERLTSRNNKRGETNQGKEWAYSTASHLVLSPPRYERTINVQEAETILCKWKSYMGGRYHVGEDVAACKQALLRFPRIGLCQKLLATGRQTELW